jgi:hypothetical protein
MAIQGVKGNVFELLVSTDKKIQEFITALEPGDNLRGRVVEVMPQDGKAIINFKGYNLISQLPQNTTMQKGDLINVTVSQSDNRVFMKISPETFGRGVEIQQGMPAALSTQQIIQVLNQLNIPVNEQNIYIAQKLADYHLAVTKENVADIHTMTNSYLENRGIDSRAFNIDSLAAAKDLVFTNFFRLGLELQKAADSLRNMAQVMEMRGQQLMTRNDISIKALNILNILNTASAATGGSAVLSSAENAMILSLKSPDSVTINALLSSAVKEGVITPEQSQNAFKSLGMENAVLQLGRDITVIKNGQNMDIKFSGITANLETITAQSGSTAVGELKEAMANRLFAQKNIAGVTTQSVINSDMTGILSADGKAIVAQARDLFSALSRNIFTPQNTSLHENVNATASLMKSIHGSLNDLSSMLNMTKTKSSAPEWMPLNELKSEVFRSLDGAKAVLKGLFTSGNEQEAVVKPQDYGNYQALIKNFISKAGETQLFKDAVNSADASGKQGIINTPAMFSVALPVDTESTIEAMVFLKSRNLPAENRNFVDIMSKYFRNDMKLNGSIEKLSSALAGFENAFKHAPASLEAKNSLQNIASVKNIINEITIKTNDSGLKAGLIEAQFRNFIEKSGLNLENRLLNQVLSAGRPGQEPQAQATAALNQMNDLYAGSKTGNILPTKDNLQVIKYAKNASDNTSLAANSTASVTGDNLKSKVLELINSLNIAADSKISAQQKQAMRHVKEAAGELLTNLNALSLINQRPVSFDMAYTQIPVFFNNKLFNGELQVWYRKGAQKEDLKNNTIPVNMVFMLNTSNLGPVKVSVTVYKNEVECTVRAESEKAKQALMRNKNEFLGSLQGLNYNIKNFNVQLDSDGVAPPSFGEGYINIESINIQA